MMYNQIYAVSKLLPFNNDNLEGKSAQIFKSSTYIRVYLSKDKYLYASHQKCNTSQK